MLEDDTKRRRVGDAIHLWGEVADWLEKALLGLSDSERRSCIIEDLAKHGAPDITWRLGPAGTPPVPCPD
jgi:hypothetical protein